MIKYDELTASWKLTDYENILSVEHSKYDFGNKILTLQSLLVNIIPLESFCIISLTVNNSFKLHGTIGYNNIIYTLHSTQCQELEQWAPEIYIKFESAAHLFLAQVILKKEFQIVEKYLVKNQSSL